MTTAPAGFPVHEVPDDAVVTLPSPDWLATDGEAVWVRLDGGEVLLLDPETGETEATVAVGGDVCQGIGAGLGFVWSCSGTDIARVDPATGEVDATFPVNKAYSQGHLATAAGLLWVLTGDGGTLLGLDPATGAATTTVALGVRGTDLAAGEAGLWVVSAVDGAAVRVDPGTAAVDRRVDGLGRPMVAAVTDQVWVSGGSTTTRIDPESGSVLVTAGFGTGQDGGLAVADDRVWVRNAEHFLVALDAADGRPVAGYSWDEATAGGDVLVAAGALWATAYQDRALVRLDPSPGG
ncbi:MULTISPECIES: outer membrane protein assembly factor BamB family protein [unclassified Blastococcus]